MFVEDFGGKIGEIGFENIGLVCLTVKSNSVSFFICWILVLSDCYDILQVVTYGFTESYLRYRALERIEGNLVAAFGF